MPRFPGLAAILSARAGNTAARAEISGPGSANEANARKVALTEQRRAKRARSKKRFAFWADVAARVVRSGPL